MEIQKSKTISKQLKQYDGNLIGVQFIDYFYKLWVSNPIELITNNIIEPYSKLKYGGKLYKGNDFVQILAGFTSPGFQFVDCKWEILDSESRQVYIMVTGTINNDFLTHQNTFMKFSQSFTIVYAGNNKKSLGKWTLINSILII